MASRICPKCGQEAPRTAKFCSQCSASLLGETTATTQTAPGERTLLQNAATQSKLMLISVLGLTVVVLAGVAVYSLNKSSAVIHAAPPVQFVAPPVIQAPPAPVQPAPPVTQAPEQLTPAPPVTDATTPTALVPPPEIVSYLAFIQQMELRRSGLDHGEVAAILPLRATANSLKTDTDEESHQTGVNQINQAMSSNLQQWQMLIKEFQQQTPPDGCVDLGNAYDKLLEDYTDLCSQIEVALDNGDTAKVMSLQGAQGIVDQDAATADGALSAVCTKYNAKKLFAISVDGSSSTSPVVGG